MAGLPRVWRRYRLRLAARLVVLAAASAGVVALSTSGKPWGMPGAVVAGLVALRAGWSAARASERPARDVTRFLEGVRYDDMSGRFSAPSEGEPFGSLAAAFEEVGEAFRRVRAEREEQATYLGAVVRHVGVALVAFRTDGEVTLFNLAARRALGVPRPRSLDALRRRAPEAADALQSLTAGERSLVRLDAEAGPLELVAYATRFAVGDATHTLVSLQDIRQELEARELEAWQDLSRVLTHEITNSVAPISSLAGTARGLLDGGDALDAGRAADVREALGTIERRSRSLVAFVEAYRTLAKLPQPTPRVIGAAELLGDVALLARASAPGVGVAVEVEPERLEIVADPDLVEQALVNLALNAVEAQAGREGGHVWLRAFPAATGRVVIEVVDDGPGLAPGVADRAFTPFFSTKPGGSGIGLALAHRIARLHGGTLTVESEPDVRTAFALRF